jgi:hypothetical protein
MIAEQFKSNRKTPRVAGSERVVFASTRSGGLPATLKVVNIFYRTEMIGFRHLN